MLRRRPLRADAPVRASCPYIMPAGAAAVSDLYSRGIIQPAGPLAVVLIALETIGGLCIALRLFTRFWALGIAIEMAVIVFQYIPSGFGWTRPGYEYPLMWSLVALAIAMRGGGPWSPDRKLGREL